MSPLSHPGNGTLASDPVTKSTTRSARTGLLLVGRNVIEIPGSVLNRMTPVEFVSMTFAAGIRSGK